MLLFTMLQFITILSTILQSTMLLFIMAPAPAPLVAHAPFAAIKPFVHHGLPPPFGCSPCSC